MPRLTEGSNVHAGTLNPHLPKRTITSLEILDWLNELKGLTKKKCGIQFRHRDRRGDDLVKNPSPFGALSHIERLG
jgi:hypothetical protein